MSEVVGARMIAQRGCRVIVCHPELLLGQAISAALATVQPGVEPVTVTTAKQLLTQVGTGYDVALVSDALGDQLGELLEALAFRDPNLPVLVLCRRSDYRAAAEVLELGAVGSVSSESSVDELSAAVGAACQGQVVFLDGAVDDVRAALAERRADRSSADGLYRSLTERERMIATALADGRTAGEIARSLSLSPHTIRAAIRTVGEKLDAKGQLRIAAAARDLLHTISPPSRRFVRLQESWRNDSRAG